MYLILAAGCVRFASVNQYLISRRRARKNCGEKRIYKTIYCVLLCIGKCDLTCSMGCGYKILRLMFFLKKISMRIFSITFSGSIIPLSAMPHRCVLVYHWCSSVSLLMLVYWHVVLMKEETVSPQLWPLCSDFFLQSFENLFVVVLVCCYFIGIPGLYNYNPNVKENI